MIFVFGSNLAGRHGAGAALFAKRNHGAKYGQGIGRQGNSYAIPTKDENLNPLPLDEIAKHVSEFLDYARRNQEELFQVTKIGCGLAGFTVEQIAPMFYNSPKNCILSEEFDECLKRTAGSSFHEKNCPIRERTADGRSVGRCWFHTGDNGVCPRHGDVKYALERLPKLTDENEHDERNKK